MDSNHTVSANYIDDPELDEVDLIITSTNNGEALAGVTIKTMEYKYGPYGGVTPYRLTLEQNTNVFLTAPEYHGSGASRKRFSEWFGAVTSTERFISVSMNVEKSVNAIYIDDPTDPAPPPRVTLSSPARNGAVAGTSITFKWNAADRATKYQIEIRLANGTIFKKRTWVMCCS